MDAAERRRAVDTPPNYCEVERDEADKVVSGCTLVHILEDGARLAWDVFTTVHGQRVYAGETLVALVNSEIRAEVRARGGDESVYRLVKSAEVELLAWHSEEVKKSVEKQLAQAERTRKQTARR